MKKTNTDELVKLLDKKPKKKSKNNDTGKRVASWLKVNVWDSRPIHWLGIGLAYTAIAYTSYTISKYYIGIPEFTGIVAFIATLTIGSRTFKKQ